MNAGRRSPVERLLALFAPVRPGEGSTVLLLAANVFLLLTAYYIIKPVREALILAGSGAEVKAYASAGQAFLLLLVVPLYARVASALPRRRLINGVTLFFVVCLGAFYLLVRAGFEVGVVFYLWVGIFNLMVVAQFWSFANDVYTEDQGKRLFAIVAFGANAGAVLGSKITDLLVEPLGIPQLLLVSAGILGGSLLLTNTVEGRDAGRKRAPAARAAGEPPPEEALGRSNAFALVVRNRYLLAVALFILVLNLVNTTGEYILGRVVASAAVAAEAAGTIADQGVFIGAFYGDFFFVVNLLSMAIQLFLVSRIIRYLGVRVALLIPPIVALGAYGLLAAIPVLGVVRWSKTVENSLDYSLTNTLRGVLFLPTTREEKYKAKQAIDTFFVRTGDALQAGLVYAGTVWWGFATRDFALTVVGLILVWIALAWEVGRRYRRLAREARGEGAGAAGG